MSRQLQLATITPSAQYQHLHFLFRCIFKYRNMLKNYRIQLKKHRESEKKNNFGYKKKRKDFLVSENKPIKGNFS